MTAMARDGIEAALRIALIAHDARKDDMVAWVGTHYDRLRTQRLDATGTTVGRILDAYPELDVTRLKSGPLGGDQQIGALIAEGVLDGLIFFVDPLSAMPHDVDIKALTRLAVVYDIPLACSRATADLVIEGLRNKTA
jgi:methylglyoxal synthase